MTQMVHSGSFCGFCGAHLWGLLVWFLENESTQKHTSYHQVPKSSQYYPISNPYWYFRIPFHLSQWITWYFTGPCEKKLQLLMVQFLLLPLFDWIWKFPKNTQRTSDRRLPPKHPNCLGLPSKKIKWPQNVCIMMLPWNKVWAKNRTYSIDSNPIGNRWTRLFEWYIYHETKYRRERTYYKIHVEENCGNKWFYNTHASSKQISSLWPASRARLSREHVPFRKNRNTWLTQEAWMIS